MARLFSDALYYYGVKGQRTNTVRYVVRMQDEVDGDALRKAVDTALLRYPYFKLKVVKTRNSIYTDANYKDVVIVNSDVPVPLGGAEANEHLIAFGYKDNNIIMYNFHGLIDGRGRGPFLKTLIYYYCSFRYDEEVQMDGVNLVDTPIDPLEYTDPFLDDIPAGRKFKPAFPRHKVMDLHKMGLVTPSAPQVHCVKIPESQFISWCKQHDATPNTAISLFMCRAVQSLHPDSGKTVCAGVCCDLRGVMKAPKTHYSLVTVLPLAYYKGLSDKEIDTQCTAMRGQLVMQSDPDSLRSQVALVKSVFQLASKVPTRALKAALLRAVVKKVGGTYSFMVSYSGKVSYGSCDKHIRGLYSDPNQTGVGMLTEITVADGHVLLNCMQEWKEDVYFNAFLDQLKSFGLDYEVVYSGPSGAPAML